MKLTAKILCTAIIVLCALRLGTSTDFYTAAMISGYFAITLLGAVIIHFGVKPSWRDAALVALGSIVFAFIDFRLLHFKPAIVCWLSFAGLVSLAIMGVNSVWAESEARKTQLLAFMPSLLFVISEYFADNMLRWAATVHDKVYDLYLYAFDASLHVQAPFAVGRFFAQHNIFRQVALLAYIGLSVPIAVVYSSQVRRVGLKALQCFAAFIATGPIGFLFYNAVPALGPTHIFAKAFPWHPLATDQVRHLFLEPIAVGGPRNAIPSLHMAWVLLAWWYSRELSVSTRAIALFYVVFVALATLGTGEHYLIDLVVAVPFALFIESLFAYDLTLFDSNRVRGIAFGLLSTCAWLAALRLTPHVFWITPVFPWSLSAATVGVALYFEMHLRDSGKSAPRLAPQSHSEKMEHAKTSTSTNDCPTETDSTPVLAETPKL